MLGLTLQSDEWTTSLGSMASPTCPNRSRHKKEIFLVKKKFFSSKSRVDPSFPVGPMAYCIYMCVCVFSVLMLVPGKRGNFGLTHFFLIFFVGVCCNYRWVLVSLCVCVFFFGVTQYDSWLTIVKNKVLVAFPKVCNLCAILDILTPDSLLSQTKMK